MLIKKIFAGAAVFIAAIFLTGCGSKSALKQDSSQREEGQMKINQTAKEDNSSKMPEANGDVDDTVDAIVSGAESESAQATSVDSEASLVAGDSDETNNLNNAYDLDQKEL